MDAQSRQSIAFHMGDRSRERAQALGAKIPEVSPQQATFHTDQDDGYNGVIPAERHKAITKTARTTNHIEPVQQHLEATPVAPGARHAVIVQEGRNHIGAITFFSCHDNLEKAAALPLLHYPIFATKPTAAFRCVAHTIRAMLRADFSTQCLAQIAVQCWPWQESTTWRSRPCV
jgi:hypothetical protein